MKILNGGNDHWKTALVDPFTTGKLEQVALVAISFTIRHVLTRSSR